MNDPALHIHVHVSNGADKKTRRNLQQLQTKVTTMADQIDALTGGLTALDDKLTAAQTALDAKQEAIAGTLAELRAHVAELEAAGQAVDPRIVAALATLESVSAKADDLIADVNSTDTGAAPADAAPVDGQ